VDHTLDGRVLFGLAVDHRVEHAIFGSKKTDLGSSRLYFNSRRLSADNVHYVK
jgi:hypothetical protein